MGCGSPRARVASQLQRMHLQPELSLPILDFSRGRHGSDGALGPQTLANGTPNSSIAFPDPAFPDPAFAARSAAIQPSASLIASSPPTQQPLMTHQPVEASTLEPPATPQLKPVSLASDRTISPLPSKRLKPPRRSRSPPPPAATSSAVNNTASSSSTEPSSLVWTDAEITGYDPMDPLDDGYGVNGVGFRPTAAVAYARTQRRKQQLADWKSREAREARQRRSERRKEGDGGLGDAVAVAVGVRVGGTSGEGRRVRFVEG